MPSITGIMTSVITQSGSASGMSRSAPVADARTTTSWPASVSMRDTSASVSGSSSTMKNFMAGRAILTAPPGATASVRGDALRLDQAGEAPHLGGDEPAGFLGRGDVRLEGLGLELVSHLRRH